MIFVKNSNWAFAHRKLTLDLRYIQSEKKIIYLQAISMKNLVYV